MTLYLAVAGGLTALQDISRLEDLEFTIKDAKVYTLYPGATFEEVGREITYHIENAIQELSQLKRVESISQAGFSEVTVKIINRFKKPDFPRIRDEIRRKVNDVQNKLPPGATAPRHPLSMMTSVMYSACSMHSPVTAIATATPTRHRQIITDGLPDHDHRRHPAVRQGAPTIDYLVDCAAGDYWYHRGPVVDAGCFRRRSAEITVDSGHL